MTARRDRALSHAALTNLRTVLEDGRWPTDGPDLLEAALEHTARRSLGERVRARWGAETALIIAGALGTALSASAWSGWTRWPWPIWLLGLIIATCCLTWAGMVMEAKDHAAETLVVHRQLRELRDLVVRQGKWVAGCTDLLSALLHGTQPTGRHR